MTIAQGLLPEFDQEMANTRKTLERVPDDKWDYKPHSKSGTMGWYAAHLANLASWPIFTIGQDELDLSQPFDMPSTKNRQEVLAVLDKNVADARKAIAGASDQELMKTWTLKKGGQTLMSLPKIAVLRGFVMNHIIHHRGQLTVYLRLNDIPVPALYGPSGDEGNF
ncbi:MAG: DinB family protein [Terriglobales bacterium]